MSFLGIGKSNNNNQQQQNMAMVAAIQAQQAADEQNRKLAEGNAGIDKAFLGFDDGFYNKYRDAYTSYQLPKLGDMFTDSKNKLTYGLANAGLLNSTAAADAQAKLLKQNEDAMANIYKTADSQTGALKSRVASEKAAAQEQLKSTMDPTTAINFAANSARGLQASTPSYDTLSGIFDIGTIGASGFGNGYNTQSYMNQMPTNGYYGNASRIVGG